MRLLLLTGTLMATLSCMAQETRLKDRVAEVDMDSPTFVPTVKVGKVFEGGDSIQYMEMNNVYVFPPVSFESKKQAAAYMRLVKNVKTVLPIAKEANIIMMETAEYLETLPNKKAREEHMKRVEQSILKEYKPRMKKLTYSQGKLLIKLVYRESSSSGSVDSTAGSSLPFGTERADFPSVSETVKLRTGKRYTFAFSPSGAATIISSCFAVITRRVFPF